LAAPAAIAVATGRAALEGMLFKDAETFERSQNVRTIVFDKTGTLTEGKPRVVRAETFFADPTTALGVVAAVERRSEHPVAKAVADYAEREGAPVFDCLDFHNEPGAGAAGTVEGRRALVGTRAFLEGEGVEIAETDEEGVAYAYAAIDETFAARFAIDDEIRASAKPALAELAALGLRAVMLTGDRREVAERVARELGIDEVIAEVKPGGKVEEIERLRARSDAPVAMAGDGINDAPALAAADVGIAVGSGADATLETAPVALLSNDLRGVPAVIRASRRTTKIIRQNFFWAFVYNSMGVPLAAFGLLDPMVAALAMSFSSVSVVSNSLRLRRGG
jgi:Cu+-exporting ATPase